MQEPKGLAQSVPTGRSDPHSLREVGSLRLRSKNPPSAARVRFFPPLKNPALNLRWTVPAASPKVRSDPFGRPPESMQEVSTLSPLRLHRVQEATGGVEL